MAEIATMEPDELELQFALNSMCPSNLTDPRDRALNAFGVKAL
jgi:hypothetical protein